MDDDTEPKPGGIIPANDNQDRMVDGASLIVRPGSKWIGLC